MVKTKKRHGERGPGVKTLLTKAAMDAAAANAIELEQLEVYGNLDEMMQTPPIDVLVRLAHRSARYQGGDRGLTPAVPGDDSCSRQCRRASIVAPTSTVTELMRLTRIELYDLLTRITTVLAEFPEGSAERANALLNLGNIRRVLVRRDFSP
jgi:hypothetical protein